ncbi:YdeI/OmpD-associated family protein [Hymenobacter radiodurans]|uniref:YdeI/OmpD-associated family protein n=1 Tax=Hymenobacter radiodurans TaxID=2496028 RepID=UPI0010585A99|nr:YdeI/OmpD-associated family protein [Hymenobacter radiodurans]
MARIIDSYEIVDAPDPTSWRAWLVAHYASSPGVWLVLYKKASGRRQMTYAEAVEEALCYGWIDSLPRLRDENCFHLLFTPRKPRSVWSKVNKQRIETLLADGRMTPAGWSKIEVARQDGSWDTLNASDALEMPPELAAALAANVVAQHNFAAFPPSAKRQIIQYLNSAKRPETRQKRVEQIVALAAENKRLS